MCACRHVQHAPRASACCISHCIQITRSKKMCSSWWVSGRMRTLNSVKKKMKLLARRERRAPRVARGGGKDFRMLQNWSFHIESSCTLSAVGTQCECTWWSNLEHNSGQMVERRNWVWFRRFLPKPTGTRAKTPFFPQFLQNGTKA